MSFEHERPWKPTKEQLLAARNQTSLPHLIKPDLKVVFCGINPGLYTAAIGHHFGRPGNRFWPTLHRAGFTNRLLTPFEERELLDMGWGITNIVDRATATAAELSAEELAEGGQLLKRRIKTFQPEYLAVLGVTAYRSAFARPKAKLGLQDETIANAKTRIWVLPNPSGLNAHYQADDLVKLFRELRDAV